MKTLLDRFSDLISVRKDLGRRLKGRRAFALACGSEAALPEGFEVPFRETAVYLDLDYGGCFYGQTSKAGVLSSVAAPAQAFGWTLFV